MIDYIKAKYTEPYQLNTEIVDFNTRVNIATGETDGKYTGKYHQLQITQYPSGGVYIEGSLHKFFNKAEFNGNDFSYKNLNKAVNEIERVLGMKPSRLKLANLEYGVNVTLPFDANKVLNNLLFYRNKEFTKSINTGNFREVENTQYFVKMYDKYTQYKDNMEVILANSILPNTLRFEIKHKKMKALNDRYT